MTNKKNHGEKRDAQNKKQNIQKKNLRKQKQVLGKKCCQIENMVRVHQSVEGMRNDNEGQSMEVVSFEECENHYQKLLTDDRDQFKRDVVLNTEIIKEKNEYLVITEQENRKNQEGMKNGLSPGLRNIPIELIKYGGNKIIDRISKFLNTYLSAKQTPTE